MDGPLLIYVYCVLQNSIELFLLNLFFCLRKVHLLTYIDFKAVVQIHYKTSLSTHMSLGCLDKKGLVTAILEMIFDCKLHRSLSNNFLAIFQFPLSLWTFLSIFYLTGYRRLIVIYHGWSKSYFWALLNPIQRGK